MNLLAKHEIEYIASCCDDRADVCGRQIAGIYVECDFCEGVAVFRQEKFDGGNVFCEPKDEIYYYNGNVKRIWSFPLNEKS